MIRNRYPRSDILSQRGHWDAATRRVVMDRVHNVPDFTYFSADERRTLEALCARVVPQDHHPEGQRVPIAAWIDERCTAGETTEGFRYDDMPAQPDAWRRGLAGLDQTARALHGKPFADLDGDRQDGVLRTIRRGDPPGEAWQSLPARRWWVALALRQITGIYYAHPVAWDEIGYGGPAYPRGYAALNHGAREWWEAKEDEEARRLDEADRLHDAARSDRLEGVPGDRLAHLQAEATTAFDGVGPRPARDPAALRGEAGPAAQQAEQEEAPK